MRKLIIAAVTVATLAVPAVSMADAPVPGAFDMNPAAQANTNPHASQIGQQSSQIKQNGWWVSNTQVTSPEGRGGIVQSILHP